MKGYSDFTGFLRGLEVLAKAPVSLDELAGDWLQQVNGKREHEPVGKPGIDQAHCDTWR